MSDQIQSMAEFVDRLNSERKRRGMSIRAAASVAGVPAATVQGWLGGKHLPTPALRDNFLQLVRHLGLSPVFSDDFWLPQKATADRRLGRSPYLGLRPFTRQESDLFFGRQSALDQLRTAVARNQDGGPVVLLGASGSGKSSLLAAGLLGGSDDSDWVDWPVSALLSGETPPSAKVIVIDQFEDIFLAESAEHIWPVLAELAQSSTLLLSLRSDAFASALEVPWLAQAMSRPVLLSTLTLDEVRQAIVEPAKLLGVTVDDELVDLLISDICPVDTATIPSDVLPLLSNVLLMTWQAGRGDRMTANDYLSVGGVAKTVERQAERVFSELSAPQQVLAEALFLQLIGVTADSVVREKVSFDSLDTEILPIVDSFVEARLLTLGNGGVRIGHDVLLRRWPRLTNWIDQNRNDLFVAAQLKRATAIWLESQRDPAALIPVQRLPMFTDLASDPQRQAWLSSDDREYIETSNQHFSDALENERKITRKIRSSVRVAGSMAIVSLILAVIAGTMFFRVNRISLEAQSRQVALAASVVRGDDPYLESQLSILADDLSDTRQARSALLNATSTDSPIRWVGAPSAVAVATSDLVVRADGRGAVTYWRGDDITRTPGQTVEVDPGAGSLFALAVGKVAGRTLVAVGGINIQELWDFTDTPTRLADLRAFPVTSYSAAFSETAARVAFGMQDGRLLTWDISNPATPVISPMVTTGTGSVRGLAFDAEGKTLWSVGETGFAQSWRWETSWVKDRTLPFGTDRLGQSVALSPDGRRLAVGVAGRLVLIWDLTAKTEPTQLTNFKSWINSVRFTLDSEDLLVGSSDQMAYVFSGPKLAETRKMPHPVAVTSVVPFGERLVTASGDGSIRVWSAMNPQLLTAAPEGYDLAASRNWLVDATNAGGYPLWHRENGRWVRQFDPEVPSGVKSGSGVVISPDEKFMFGGSSTGQVLIWDVATRMAPTVVDVDPGAYIGNLALSPSGDLLAVSSYYGTKVTLYQVSKGTLTKVAALPAASPQVVSFSRDGRTLFVPIGNRGVDIWDVSATPKVIGSLTDLESVPLSSAVATGHDWLAVGLDSGKILIYDYKNVSEPRLISTLAGPNSSIPALTFSNDDELLTAPSFDSHLWIWKMDDLSAPWAAINPGLMRLNDVVFTGNREIAVVGQNGEVRTMVIDPLLARKQLCAATGSGLTDDEWKRQLPGIGRRDPCR